MKKNLVISKPGTVLSLTSFVRGSCAAESNDEDHGQSDQDHVDGIEPGVFVAVVDDPFEDISAAGINDGHLQIVGLSGQGIR